MCNKYTSAYKCREIFTPGSLALELERPSFLDGGGRGEGAGQIHGQLADLTLSVWSNSELGRIFV